MWTNKYDPVMTCQPLGVPRQGPPRRIYQSESDITFLYFGGDAGGGYGEYRVIPTDGRKRSKEAEFDITYGEYGGTLGGRHTRARLHRVHRYDMAGARRFLPLRSDACRGAIHASGRCHPGRRHGRRPSAAGAVGVADENATAQHESQRGPSARARQLRNEFRDRSGRHADSALAGGDEQPRRIECKWWLMASGAEMMGGAND